MPKKGYVLRNRIKRLKADENRDSIRWHVLNFLQWRYRTDEEIEIFVRDLMRCGCISGMVGHLIYYYDAHKFFDKYYEDIEEIREDWEDSLGEPIKIEGDLKNTLAWFGFERTVCHVADELEIEY